MADLCMLDRFYRYGDRALVLRQNFCSQLSHNYHSGTALAAHQLRFHPRKFRSHLF